MTLELAMSVGRSVGHMSHFATLHSCLAICFRITAPAHPAAIEEECTRSWLSLGNIFAQSLMILQNQKSQHLY